MRRARKSAPNLNHIGSGLEALSALPPSKVKVLSESRSPRRTGGADC